MEAVSAAILAALAVGGAIGAAARWWYQREQTTKQAANTSAAAAELEKEFSAYKLHVAETYVRRDDYAVSSTRMEHKIDIILQHMAGIGGANKQ